MERTEAMEVVSILTDSPNRIAILNFVGEEPAGVADVSSALDIPRATAKHNLQRLLEYNLVDSVGSRYIISTFGTYVYEIVTDCLDRTVVSRNLYPFLQVVPDSTFDPDLSMFRDSTVTAVTATNPHAPVERLLELVNVGEYLRVVTPVIFPRLAEYIHERVVERGYRVDLIVSTDTFEVLQEKFPDEYEQALESERLIVGIVPDPIPFGLFLFDDKLALSGHDEKNILRCLVENDSAVALEWANDTFREFEQVIDSQVWHDEDIRTS